MVTLIGGSKTAFIRPVGLAAVCNYQMQPPQQRGCLHQEDGHGCSVAAWHMNSAGFASGDTRFSDQRPCSVSAEISIARSQIQWSLRVSPCSGWSVIVMQLVAIGDWTQSSLEVPSIPFGCVILQLGGLALARLQRAGGISTAVPIIPAHRVAFILLAAVLHLFHPYLLRQRYLNKCSFNEPPVLCTRQLCFTSSSELLSDWPDPSSAWPLRWIKSAASLLGKKIKKGFSCKYPYRGKLWFMVIKG